MTFAQKVARIANAYAGVRIEAVLFYEFCITQDIPDLAVDTDIRLRHLESADLDALYKTPESVPALATPRLDRGDECYIAYSGDRVAHHTWIQSSGVHPIVEAGYECTVEPGDFWIYHCWTADWARGRRLYPTVLAYAVRDQFSRGRKRARIYTTQKNTASQRGIMRAGFRPTESVRALRMGTHYLRLS